ncbi:MAG: hypothetical protein ACLFVH_04760 [Phycisphaerae bacterium]
MGHWRVQRKELLQVQIVTGLALAVTYFLLWPMLRPADPDGPLALLAEGNAPGILAILLVMAVLAAITSAVTVHSRPVGSIVAALLGTGGLCMHSPPLKALLWAREGEFGGLFMGFIFELLALSVGVIVVCLVVGLVRQGIAGINPRWVWRDPLMSDEAAAATSSDSRKSHFAFTNPFAALLEMIGQRGSPHYGKKRSALDEAKALAGCLFISAVLAVVLYMILVQSRERGQVLFALLASFTVAVLVAHQASPTSLAGPLLAMPVVLGVVIYLLGMFASAGPVEAHNAWLRVPPYAHALPLDWITAGVGGAGLGFWISSRIHELRHMEKQEQQAA